MRHSTGEVEPRVTKAAGMGADKKYRIPRKRPWALNPLNLNQGGVGAYPGWWVLTEIVN